MNKNNHKDLSGKDWLDEPNEFEGQLAIDAHQTENNVVIHAPLAGVNPEDVEIAITDEVVTIKGERKKSSEINRENYFAQECYWGGFSRSYLLPVAVDSENANAQIKNGILTITIPKMQKSVTRIVKVHGQEQQDNNE